MYKWYEKEGAKEWLVDLSHSHLREVSDIMEEAAMRQHAAHLLASCECVFEPEKLHEVTQEIMSSRIRQIEAALYLTYKNFATQSFLIPGELDKECTILPPRLREKQYYDARSKAYKIKRFLLDLYRYIDSKPLYWWYKSPSLEYAINLFKEENEEKLLLDKERKKSPEKSNKSNKEIPMDNQNQPQNSNRKEPTEKQVNLALNVRKPMFIESAKELVTFLENQNDPQWWLDRQRFDWCVSSFIKIKSAEWKSNKSQQEVQQSAGQQESSVNKPAYTPPAQNSAEVPVETDMSGQSSGMKF